MYTSVLSVFRKLFAYIILVGVFVVCAFFINTPASATTGINQQVNFQGRLLNAQGATVPDGYYNIQFKIYQDGDGLSTGDTTGTPAGSLKWTESYVDNNANQGVLVKNGFMSVQLGSIVPFGASVNWNQDTLWLSMNIAGSNNTCTTFNTGSCIADGEMVPMKRLSSSTYSLNSGQLGGLTASQFIQNTTTLQIANIAVQSGNSTNIAALIQGAASQSADIFQVKATGTTTPLLAVSSVGKLTLQPVADTSEIFSIKSSLGNNMFTVDSLNNRVGIGLGGSTAPNLAANGVEVLGALRLSGGIGGLNQYVDNYITPLGSSVKTKINIPSYDPGNYGQVLALGLPSTASSTARAVSLLDARTTAHQPTLAVFSPDENNILGFSWDGSNTTGYVKSTTSTVAIQGNGVSLLTATNNAGNANVGIGNSATNGYALDVTGDISSSTQYRVAGVVTLTNSALTFSGASTANIQSAAGQSLNLNGLNGISIQTNGITRATFNTANSLYLGNGVTAAAPSNFTVSGTGSATTAVAGGTVAIQGGNATVGSANGGNITLSGGTGIGTGTNGLVVLSTPTFSTTANDPNCYTGGALVAASCTIAATSVNNSSAILAGFTTLSQTATLPNPTNATAGRVVYITAANGSNDFTLSVNGGGTGNTISMRQNTTATMIWNGSAWTAAGASSSTTLQSAYDNTLQGAGGAELVVSHTATTNGLTIRDSSTSSVNGTLLQVQSKTAANIFSVSSNVSDYISDPGAEVAGGSPSTFPSSTWAATGGATVSRNTNTVNSTIATGQASIQVATSTAVNSGTSNQIVDPTSGSVVSLTANTQYNVSLSARLPSGAGIFNNLTVLYQYDSTSTHTVACTSGQSIAQTSWTKINCSFTTPVSGITTANIIRIEQANSGTSRTFYIDNLSLTIAAGQNYATDGGVDSALGTNWVAVGGSATQSTTTGYDTSDSAQVTTTTSTASGVKNKLSANPIPSTASTTYLYRISVEVQTQTAALANFTIQYSYNNSTLNNCVDYNTQAVPVSSTQWTQITCIIQMPTNTPTAPYVFFTQGDTTARGGSLYIDTLSMTLANSTTPDVQIGSGTSGGPVTLFTLDSAASAPIAANNTSLYGSMYYDTSQGKIQCYQASGWGACGASPDNIVTISPEYTNAVMHGTGVGTMVSDFCSSAGGVNINDGTSGQPTICGLNETYNFYRWTSPQPTPQAYSIYVTYQLPSTFKQFASGQTSLQARVDSTSNAFVKLQIYKNHNGLTTCGNNVTITTTASTWQYPAASGTADPSTCGFSGSDSIVFKITTSANSNANAYVGNLNFTFSNS